MLSAALRLFSLATAPPAPRIQRFTARRISPLSRTRSASRHPSLYARNSSPSPPLSLAARSVAAYLKIRRQANLPAWPYPFRLPPSFSLCPPSLPLPALFRWRRKASPRIQRFAARRISPLGRTRSASRHPSLYARPDFRSPPLSLAARSVAAYPKDSPSGESPRFGWGGLSKRGAGPLSHTHNYIVWSFISENLNFIMICLSSVNSIRSIRANSISLLGASSINLCANSRAIAAS